MRFFLLLFFLSACTSINFTPFHGTKEIIGSGGLYDGTVFTKDIISTKCDRLFRSKECGFLESGIELYDEVNFYYNGLPEEQHCLFLGQLTNFGEDYADVAAYVLKIGGNVATRSDISFYDDIGENGIMIINENAGSHFIGTINETQIYTITYNIFECL